MKPLSLREAASLWKCNRARISIPTGIKPLDDMLCGGLPVRQITTLGAYTGNRKSEFARQIARRVTQIGYRAVMVDVELGADRIFERFYVQEAQMTRGMLAEDDYMNEEERHESENAMSLLENNTKLSIYAPGNMPPLDKILDTLHEDLELTYQIDRKPVLVIFDSIQRLSLGQPIPSPRECMTRFMGELENFAHSHNVAVLAVSELSRDPKGGIPKQGKLLTSLAESRAIEYVSDAVMFLIQDKKHPAENEAAYHIVIDKNRSGELGMADCKLVFTYPFWGMRLDADEMVGLQKAVLEFFNKGPSTIDDCSQALKKRRSTIAKIVREFEAVNEIKSFKSPGYKGLQLVGRKWQNPADDFEENEPDGGEDDDENQERNRELIEESDGTP